MSYSGLLGRKDTIEGQYGDGSWTYVWLAFGRYHDVPADFCVEVYIDARDRYYKLTYQGRRNYDPLGCENHEKNNIVGSHGVELEMITHKQALSLFNERDKGIGWYFESWRR